MAVWLTIVTVCGRSWVHNLGRPNLKQHCKRLFTTLTSMHCKCLCCLGATATSRRCALLTTRGAPRGVGDRTAPFWKQKQWYVWQTLLSSYQVIIFIPV